MGQEGIWEVYIEKMGQEGIWEVYIEKMGQEGIWEVYIEKMGQALEKARSLKTRKLWNRNPTLELKLWF